MNESEKSKGIAEGVVLGAKVVSNVTKWPVAECGIVGELYSFRDDDDAYRLRFVVHGQDPEFVFESLTTGHRERLSARRISEITSRGKLRRVEIRLTDFDSERAWLLSVLDAFIAETNEIIDGCGDEAEVDPELAYCERLHLIQLQMEASRCHAGSSSRVLDHLRVQLSDSVDHAHTALQNFPGGPLNEPLKKRLENVLVRAADRSFRTATPGDTYFLNAPCSFGDIVDGCSDEADLSDWGA